MSAEPQGLARQQSTAPANPRPHKCIRWHYELNPDGCHRLCCPHCGLSYEEWRNRQEKQS